MFKAFVLSSFCLVFSFALLTGNEHNRVLELEFVPIDKIKDSSKKIEQYQEIKLSMLKFYIGHFTFYYRGEIQWKKRSYHLVDFQNKSSNPVIFNVPHALLFDRITYNIGVDGSTNISGAYEGDLDPVKGMYWTWNSGFINSKIEGSIVQNDTSMIDFKFHLGGYQAPFESVRTVSFNTPLKEKLTFKVDIPAFLNEISITEKITTMAPGEKAALFSTYFSESFILDED